MIPNPKNKDEMDYIDIQKLPSVVLERLKLFDLNNKKVVYLSNHFEVDDDQIKLIARFPLADSESFGSSIFIEYNLLEQIFYDVVHSESNMNLEEHSLFAEFRMKLLHEILDHHPSFCLVDHRYSFCRGLGYVYDKHNTDRILGTFEELSFTARQSGNITVDLSHFISVRPFDYFIDHASELRFEFSSLETNKTFIITNLSGIQSNEDAFHSLSVGDASIEVELLDPQSKRYELTQEAQEKKSSLSFENISLNDPFVQELIEHRLSLTKSLQKEIKMQKIINNFADIDLDF